MHDARKAVQEDAVTQNARDGNIVNADIVNRTKTINAVVKARTTESAAAVVRYAPLNRAVVDGDVLASNMDSIARRTRGSG